MPRSSQGLQELGPEALSQVGAPADFSRVLLESGKDRLEQILNERLLVSQSVRGSQLFQLLLQFRQIDIKIPERRIIVGLAIGGIEVDQPRNAFRMPRSDGTQLFACYRVTYEYGPVELECIEHRQNVIPEPIS